MAYDNNEQKIESVYSKRIRAGKRRTYFFDVRATRSNDYFLTITESRKRFNDNGYDRHKIFLYKEDFNKFIKALGEAVDYVKTELMPNFDFDAFNHDEQPEDGGNGMAPAASTASTGSATVSSAAVNEDKDAEIPEVAEESAPIAESNTATNSSASEEVDKW